VEMYDPTIEDSYRKQTHVDGEVAIVNVLDTAGQEQYSCLREAWYREGEGFVLAYSITDRLSFTGLASHVTQIARVRDVDNCTNIPVVVFGNKSDLETHRKVSTEEGAAFAASIGARFLEGSAKNYININEAFEQLVRSTRQLRGPSIASLQQNPENGKKKMNKKQKKMSCTLL